MIENDFGSMPKAKERDGGGTRRGMRDPGGCRQCRNAGAINASQSSP